MAGIDHKAMQSTDGCPSDEAATLRATSSDPAASAAAHEAVGDGPPSQQLQPSSAPSTAAERLQLAADDGAQLLAQELGKLTADSAARTRHVADFVLETVLVHEAAAQQLQVSWLMHLQVQLHCIIRSCILTIWPASCWKQSMQVMRVAVGSQTVRRMLHLGVGSEATICDTHPGCVAAAQLVTMQHKTRAMQ